jgi:hypothetical protein
MATTRPRHRPGDRRPRPGCAATAGGSHDRRARPVSTSSATTPASSPLGCRCGKQSPEDWRWTLDVNLLGRRQRHPRRSCRTWSGRAAGTCRQHRLDRRAGPCPGRRQRRVHRLEARRRRAVGDARRGADAIGADVGVTVLCPGPVPSRIHSAERNRPAELVAAAAGGGTLPPPDFQLTLEPVDAAEVADLVCAAIEAAAGTCCRDPGRRRWRDAASRACWSTWAEPPSATSTICVRPPVACGMLSPALGKGADVDGERAAGPERRASPASRPGAVARRSSVDLAAPVTPSPRPGPADRRSPTASCRSRPRWRRRSSRSSWSSSSTRRSREACWRSRKTFDTLWDTCGRSAGDGSATKEPITGSLYQCVMTGPACSGSSRWTRTAGPDLR